MSIGLTNNQTPASLNSAIGTLIVNIRDDLDKFADFLTWFDTLAVSDIETQFGVNANDAATLQALVGNHGTLLSIYNGNQALATALNFRANGAPVWGGQ